MLGIVFNELLLSNKFIPSLPRLKLSQSVSYNQATLINHQQPAVQKPTHSPTNNQRNQQIINTIHAPPSCKQSTTTNNSLPTCTQQRATDHQYTQQSTDRRSINHYGQAPAYLQSTPINSQSIRTAIHLPTVNGPPQSSTWARARII